MKNLKKIISTILIALFLGFQNNVFADTGVKITINQIQNTDLSVKDAFIYLGDNLIKEIPNSYKYINLEFLGVEKGTKMYEVLQKMVYLDVIKNSKSKINFNQKITGYYFYSLVNKIVKYDFISGDDILKLKTVYVNSSDLSEINDLLKDVNTFSKQDVLGIGNYNEQKKFKILKDVYETLNSKHYDSEKLDKDKMIYSSIQGLTTGVGDKHTVYFPPVESKDFSESLAGEFEGIGAYVDMEKPGELKITSPIVGSPAEKAGLKGGDIVKKVGDTEINEKFSLNQAVALIKGPAGTTVKLTILRGTETLVIEVIRAKIVIKDVEYKVINNKFFYIQIRMFGDKVYDEFAASINELKKQTGIKKIIIDLRNNPGGYLDSVSKMLSLFIEKGQPTAVVKYKTGDINYNSLGLDGIKLGDYEVYILGNSGTASASEIMIGTLKDYFPNIKFIGEKTYGKGSVQTIKDYYDGSSLKYTVARWYTGKNQTGIDGIGILPDIEVKLDTEKFKTGVDNQLDYIINN